jgi:pilus assembly protein Flp/PilA
MSRLMELSRSAAIWLKVRSNRGVSAIEYGLLAALIALVIIAAVTTLGTNLKGVFNTISTSI